MPDHGPRDTFVRAGILLGGGGLVAFMSYHLGRSHQAQADVQTLQSLMGVGGQPASPEPYEEAPPQITMGSLGQGAPRRTPRGPRR